MSSCRRNPKTRRRQRRSLRNRDGIRCHYCRCVLDFEDGQSKTFATIDHVIPLCLGGSNLLDNLVLACPRCNHDKDAGEKPREPWTPLT